MKQETIQGEWTLTALMQAHLEDLKQCTTESERQLCTAINRKEIQDKAFEIRKYRKLNPGEESVLFSI